MHLTAGCAVEATGRIVPSPAKGQPFEMQADSIRVIGWVDDPDTYPIQPKPHTLEFLREVAHLRPRTNVIGALTRVRHTIAKAIHGFFDEHGFCLGQHADHHRLGRGRRGRDVPRVHARPREPAAHAGRQGRFRAGLLRARGVSHRVRPAQRRGVLPRAVEGLHVRADVSRRELEHEPAPGRVLDDRARDRVRGARRQRRPRRGAAQAHLRHRARRARRRHGVLRGAHREGRDRQAHGDRRTRSSRAWTTPRRSRCSSARSRSSSSRCRGASTCSRSTSATSPRSTSAGR